MTVAASLIPRDRLIVVTGAAGFIGSHVLCRLAAAGHAVVGCDRFGAGERWRYVAEAQIHAWISPEALPAWLDDHAGDIAAIVHMGAISATTERDVDALVSQNIAYTLDLWERACRHDWRFVYASSAATYGAGENGFSDDDSLSHLARLAPLNAYGWSKHVIDRRIRHDVLAGMPVPRVHAGLKFFNVFGPNEDHKGDMRSLVRKIVPQIDRGEPVRLFRSTVPGMADGEQSRDFIYVKDAVRSVELALGAERLEGLFNVGTGIARSFRDLVLATYRAMNAPVRIEYVDMPERLKRKYQSFTRAETDKSRAAGLHAVAYDLEEAISDYVTEIVEGCWRTGDAFDA